MSGIVRRLAIRLGLLKAERLDAAEEAVRDARQAVEDSRRIRGLTVEVESHRRAQR